MKVKKDTKIECANLALKMPLEPEKNGQNWCLVSKFFLSLLHFLRWQNNMGKKLFCLYRIYWLNQLWCSLRQGKWRTFFHSCLRFLYQIYISWFLCHSLTVSVDSMSNFIFNFQPNTIPKFSKFLNLSPEWPEIFFKNHHNMVIKFLKITIGIFSQSLCKINLRIWGNSNNYWSQKA